MPECDSCVWGQACVSNDTQQKGKAGLSNSWGRREIELLTHAQLGVPTFVKVLGVGCQALHDHMMEERGGVIEVGVGIAEVVHLQPRYHPLPDIAMAPQRGAGCMEAKHALL